VRTLNQSHPGGDAEASPAEIRLLIVDDHEGVRAGLADLMSYEDDVTVVGECEDGSQVVEAVERLQPDVVLMDLSMPVMDGLAATRALLEVRPDARVLVLTSYGDSAKPEALAAGARGFVAKGGSSDTLLECVRLVAAGRYCGVDDPTGAA
jgi:DNA-binding NarL/FixJ family response regulator